MSIQDLPPIDEIELPPDLGNWFESIYENKNGSSNVSDVYDMYEQIYGVQFTERDLARNLIRFLSPVFLLLGTVGNVFSLVIMSKLCTEVLSTCVYLAILGGVDLFLLYMQCGNEWLRNIAEVDLTDQLSRSSVSACKAYNFAFSFFAHFYRWLMVCIAIEGTIATHTPDKINEMCTLSRAKAIILFITVLLICVNIHYFWTFELINTNDYAYIEGRNEYLCLPDRNVHALFEDYVRPIMDILVTGVLPIAVVTSCSVLIAVKTCGSQRNKEKHAAEEAWRKRYLLYPYALQRLKICILILCILFIFLTLPNSCMKLFVNRYIMIKHTGDIRLNAKKELIEAIGRLLEYMFLSFKFVIYVTVCKQFRDECGRLSRYVCSCVFSFKIDKQSQREPLLLPSGSNCIEVSSSNTVHMTELNTNNMNNSERLLKSMPMGRFTNV